MTETQKEATTQETAPIGVKCSDLLCDHTVRVLIKKAYVCGYAHAVEDIKHHNEDDANEIFELWIDGAIKDGVFNT